MLGLRSMQVCQPAKGNVYQPARASARCYAAGNKRHVGISVGGAGMSAAYRALNDKQQQYIDVLENKEVDVVVAYGKAGCGKTKLAVEVGIDKLKSGEINKIIITRPAVTVDENIGFLPGNIVSKMKPYVIPIYDVFLEHYSMGVFENMMKNGVVEICPICYSRGRTFSKAWIVCDEFQNATDSQMFMMLTRIGRGSKMVITGDPDQHDRGYEYSGLVDLVVKLNEKSHDRIKIVEFGEGDIERHRIIPFVVDLYKGVDSKSV